MEASELRFPPGFLWGVSTAAHQVEGDSGLSNWTDWESGGRIRSGDRAGKALGWWEDADGDFDLARDLSLNALRLSVEWSRIEPEDGRFEESALLRYRTMLEALRARGIRPFVCLHHFTHPRWLEARGGFLWSAAPARFERFTERVAEALGDLCTDWLTFNEPNVYASLGYLLGEFPPGRSGEFLSYARVLGAMVRAHAAAYRVLHRRVAGASVGFTVNVQRFAPARTRHLGDRILTRLTEAGFNDGFTGALAPGTRGAWLRTLVRGLGDARGTYDFVGFNHYGWMEVRFDRRRARYGFLDLRTPSGMRQGDAGLFGSYGGFDPRGLALIAESLGSHRRPIYVFEHGVPDRQDRIRPWLIARAAVALHQAIHAGADVRGYFHWTLIDNFEWTQGWALRFGLVDFDPATGTRTRRRSADLYAAIARANAVRPDDVRALAPEAYDDCFAAKVADTQGEAGSAPAGVRAPLPEP